MTHLRPNMPQSLDFSGVAEAIEEAAKFSESSVCINMLYT